MTEAPLPRCAAEMISALDRAIRAFKLYPATNPQCQEFLGRLHGVFREALAEHESVAFAVNRHEIACEGETVYSNDEPRESLALVLYKDGVRELGFTAGLDAAELQVVVQTFNRDFTLEYLDDDIGTSLWERDLPHVQVRLTEDFLDDALPEEFTAAPDPIQAARASLGIERCTPQDLTRKIIGPAAARGAPAAIPLRQAALAPGQLRLSPREQVRLRQLQATDQEHVFQDEMLEAVFALFLQERTQERMGTYLGLFHSLVESYLGAGSLARAVALLRRLRQIADSSPEAAAAVARFLGELASAEFLENLGHRLERGELHDPELFPDLLALYPPAAIPGLTALLGSLGAIRWRKLVCQALARLGEQDLTLLAAGLQDPRWFVVRNLAYTLGLVRRPEAVPHLAGLLSHPDVRVRKESLRALARSGEPAAREALVGAIGQEDEALRLQALRSLPRTADPALARELGRVVASPAFAGRGLAERAECYRALGRLSGDGIVPELERRFAARAWFLGRARREDQQLAAAALMALGSGAARAALERVVRSAEPETQRQIRAFLDTRLRGRAGR